MVLTMRSTLFYAPGAPPDLFMEFATGKFTIRSLDALLASVGPWEDGGKSVPMVSAPPGTCIVYQFTPTDKTSDFAPLVPVPWTGLRAGANLNLAGSPGAKPITSNWFDGYYKTTLGQNLPGMPLITSYLAPGDYRIDNGSGGADVGTFKASMTLPPPLVWSNKDRFTDVRRDQDLTVTWTSRNPASELVLVMGESTAATGARSSFMCAERATTGSFTVPTAVLSSLPATNPPPTSSMAAALGVLGMPLSVRFTGPGLDLAGFMYLQGTVNMVSYK